MAEKESTPNPVKDAEHAQVSTANGPRGSEGTAADALPSKESVDKGVQQAQEQAEGSKVSTSDR